MSSARPYPPSAQRVAEARAHGHVPRAPLAGVAAVALALIAGGARAMASLAGGLRQLVVAPLGHVAHGERAHALASVDSSLRGLALDLAAWLGGAWLLAIALGLMVQGGSFGAPRRRTTATFAALEPSRSAGLLWMVGLALCTGMTVYESVDARLDALPRLLGTCAQRAFALTLPCMVVDAAFARARFLASLWLTRRELHDAQREAHGSPLIRAARARLLRQARADPGASR